jgi:cold shock protein
MATGTITKWIGDRGFGFITADVGGPDLFFYHGWFDDATTPGKIVLGMRVQFEPRSSKRMRGGMEAHALRVL